MTEPHTRALHAATGTAPTGDLVPPLHLATTFAQQRPAEHAGYTYSRSSNPTVTHLEERLRALAGGIGAVAFRSGMAAIDAVLRTVPDPGQTVLVSDVVYGGTERLLREVHAPRGLEPVHLDTAHPANLEAHLDGAGLLLIETPANPTLELADLEGCIERAHQAGVPVAVDNTFLTPLGQRVLDVGADLSIHSTTKYLEGHGAAVGGAVLVRDDPDAYTALQTLRKTTGAIADPLGAWLTLRGIETLELRLERIGRTAANVSETLADHPAVESVRYPGSPEHPQHALAQRQHEHHGGLLAFELADPAHVEPFLDALDTIVLAEHLGTSRTLVTHPATMTHEAVPPKRREALGISDALLRLSVGLEASEDLVSDLEQALDALGER